jgi:Aphid transmission protein
MNNKNDFPHFYKKGKFVRIKTLDDDTEKKEYIFSTTAGKAGVKTIIQHCNNLNQIIARCFLNTSKIGHYFGISKDISLNFSKNKKPFNQFKNDLASLVIGDFEKIFEVIQEQNKLTAKLTQSLDTHSILLNKTLKNNQFVEEVAKKTNIEAICKESNLKIISIQDQLKQLIGG